MAEIKVETILLGVLILIVASVLLSPYLPQLSLTTAQGPSAPVIQTSQQSTSNIGSQQEVSQALPTYQLSEVNLYVRDKLNPKAGIAGINAEVLNVPTAPYTMVDLARVASDPNRVILDSATSTSTGLLTFNASSIFTNTNYIYSLRGDSNTYDKLVVKNIPAPSTQFGITRYTFPDPEYVYQVGSFTDIYITPEVDATTDACLNLTDKTGLQSCSWDITIAETDAGKAIKNPVLILKSPEGYELEPGDIVSLYIVRKTGTDFGISPANLNGYIDVAPIDLRGSLYDETYGVDFMTAADSATYTVKLTYDADLINPDSDKLEIILDDLGSYLGRDVSTVSTKASPQKLTISWGT